ncbi:Golgi-associated plant pathogenesis-related protein 1-like [Drosophila eugracilis]|uniref:Golgi-associated plant pathogenesis-related protein 1-like n=1 Tax=Drosophila eugracilis TaxID=29029 RepID=UPI001BDA7EA5|nr:Golgi-associated plant pathogenesis-related protein 1-like [Drosophila eugracilis]
MGLVNILIILAISWLVAVQAGVREDHLKEHNRLRSRHGCPPLQLDDKLSDDCEAYAKVLATSQKLEHSDAAGKYGENLCMRSEEPLQCDQMWYDEIEFYDFKNPGFSMETGHFTALVWKNSKTMGYGEAKDSQGRYWVVVRYYPAGNVNGQFDKNVPPREGDKAGVSCTQVQVNTILILISLYLYL